MATRKALTLATAVFLLGLIGCGGGGGGGGSDYDLAGDSELIGYWVFSAGYGPVQNANLESDGGCVVNFDNGCQATGKWYTDGSKLKLHATSVNNSSLCNSYDFGAGDSTSFHYSFTGLDEVFIENDDMEMYLVRD